MKNLEKLGFQIVSAIFMLSFMAAGSTGQVYSSVIPGIALQDAEAREKLFGELASEEDGHKSNFGSFGADIYRALQSPYGFIDPQQNLERANTYKELQKRNRFYAGSSGEDNWYYWTRLWLDEPLVADEDNLYSIMENPFAYRDPQSNLERKNTLKALQKLNGAYMNSQGEDNWDYWTNLWLASM
jgi:hypothetical protein